MYWGRRGAIYSWFVLFIAFGWSSSALAAEQQAVFIMPEDGQREGETVVYVEKLFESMGYDVHIWSAEQLEQLSEKQVGQVVVFDQGYAPWTDEALEAIERWDGEVFLIGRPPAKWNRWPHVSFSEEVRVRAVDGRPLDEEMVILASSGWSDEATIHWGQRGKMKDPFLVSEQGDAFLATPRLNEQAKLLLSSVVYDQLRVIREHPTYVLIDEVSPLSDVSQVERVFDYLETERLPYVVAVEAILTNDREIFYLRQDRALVEQLQRVTSMGGRLLVTIPERWSFLSEEEQTDQLRHTLKEWSALGIEPFGFRMEASGKIERWSPFFSHGFLIGESSLHDPPYARTVGKTAVYPQTLPAILSESSPELSLRMEHRTNELERTRGATYGWVFASYSDLHALRELIQATSEQPGVRWIDWAEQEAETKVEGMQWHFKRGQVDQVSQITMKDRIRWLLMERSNELILWSIVGIVLLFVLLFSTYLLRFRLRMRHELFHERKKR